MNSLMVNVRSAARKLGITTLIHKLRATRPYEDRFHEALQAAIRPGDHIWDIGANVGLYSELFLEWAGPTGSVIAFEPLPDLAEQIRQRLPGEARLRVENAALSSAPGTAEFVTEEYSPGSHFRRDGEVLTEKQKLVSVAIVTGDETARRLNSSPDLMKIDVEGYEEDVLNGMNTLLTSPKLRGVFVEIHFHQLELRGQKQAPVRIEKLLRSKGFHVRWTDRSHIEALRA